ncbi:hypothetical protein Tco_0239490, partial [Tanacetum coccineum]
MLLEHQDIVTEFCSPSWWKELSKETSSKILPYGDGSCWKTFKPTASLIAKGKLKLIRYFSFGRHLDELHVTWAHLEKKRTRLRTNTKTLEDLCSRSLETASPAIHDAVITHQ